MKKLKCKKCGGYYFDDDSMNSLITININTITEYAYYTSDDWEMMNPELEANTKGFLHDAKNRINRELGKDTFCECIYKKCMDNYNQLKQDFNPLGSKEKMSKSEWKELKKQGERFMRNWRSPYDKF